MTISNDDTDLPGSVYRWSAWSVAAGCATLTIGLLLSSPGAVDALIAAGTGVLSVAWVIVGRSIPRYEPRVRISSPEIDRARTEIDRQIGRR